MKISIIVTSYNVENYIEQCINSILNQTFKDFELIIVDDGSTDDTVNKIKRFDKVRLIQNKHSGAANCRNIGIANSLGKYICILDADDYFENNMLELMYNKMEKYDADIAISSAYKFDDKTGEEVITNYMLNKDVYGDLNCFSPMEIKDNIFQLTVANAWGKMFRRDFIIKNNLKFQNLKNSNDVLFVFSAIIKAGKIVPIECPLVHYRCNIKNSTQSFKSKYPCEFLKAYSELQEFLFFEKIYEYYKFSFIKMLVNVTLWNINTVDAEAKDKIIHLLKSEYYKKFNFDTITSENKQLKILKEMMN